MNKLSFHISGFDAKIFDYLAILQPPMVKILNFDSEINIKEIRRRCPGTLIVFRHYTDLTYRDPPERLIAEMENTLIKLKGFGVVYELGNEWEIETDFDAFVLSNWYWNAAALMHQRGERVAAYSFSPGNPPISLIPKLVAGLTACDFLAVHVAKNPTTGWNSLDYYKNFYDQLHTSKQTIISEIEFDDGQKHGWKSLSNKADFLIWLQSVNQKLSADPRVIGAAIFQYHDPNDWYDFDVSEIADDILKIAIQPMPEPMPQSNPQPQSNLISDFEIARLVVCNGFKNPSTAIAIVLAESNGDQFAHNAAPPDDSYGLFQINMIGKLGAARRARYHLSKNDDLFDLQINARAALDISGGGMNWRPWGAFTRKTYIPFLPRANRALQELIT